MEGLLLPCDTFILDDMTIMKFLKLKTEFFGDFITLVLCKPVVIAAV